MVILLFNAITNERLLPSTPLSLQEIHLVRCLTYISHRCFAPGRILVISSPSTYRDVQQELTAEIHQTSIWPLLVAIDANISIPEGADVVDLNGNYIIFIPDGNINILKTEFSGLAKGRKKLTGLWNSEARFVVAGPNKFSISQQTEIIDYFA